MKAEILSPIYRYLKLINWYHTFRYHKYLTTSPENLLMHKSYPFSWILSHTDNYAIDTAHTGQPPTHLMLIWWRTIRLMNYRPESNQTHVEPTEHCSLDIDVHACTRCMCMFTDMYVCTCVHWEEVHGGNVGGWQVRRGSYTIIIVCTCMKVQKVIPKLRGIPLSACSGTHSL